jgi:5-methylcytosine-specific restriction endonuclease McrA
MSVYSISTSVFDKAPAGYKSCVKCWQIKPATTDFFVVVWIYREDVYIGNTCLDCIQAHEDRIQEQRLKKEEEREEKNKLRRNLYAPLKYCKQCGKLKPNTTEYFLPASRPGRALSARCRNCVKQHNYHQRSTNSNLNRGIRYTHRILKITLPYSFSFDDEARALDYFHGYCAVCGKPLRDLFGEIEPHLDHWIALSDPRLDNPGTVPTNMVPLCNKCNLSKHNADPVKWLNGKFGPRKAKQIQQRVEAYFQWVREQDGDNHTST